MQKYLVRYDPRDLSRVYVKDHDGGQYITVPYRDISNPPITLAEQRSVQKRLGKNKGLAINEKTIFAAILDQRALVEKARKDTATARRSREKAKARKAMPCVGNLLPVVEDRSEEPAGSVEPYIVEVWE